MGKHKAVFLYFFATKKTEDFLFLPRRNRGHGGKKTAKVVNSYIFFILQLFLEHLP